MRDMQALAFNYMEEQAMTGSAGYMPHAVALVEDIASTHDRVMEKGVTAEVLSLEQAASHYCTTADRQWLRSQPLVDIYSRPYDVWS